MSKEKNSNKLYTLLANVKVIYKDSYMLRMIILGLIIFNVVMRYGMPFINLINRFYDYVGL